jgi:hypothetical protein
MRKSSIVDSTSGRAATRLSAKCHYTTIARLVKVYCHTSEVIITGNVWLQILYDVKTHVTSLSRYSFVLPV